MKKLLIVLLAIILVLTAGITLTIATTDADKYRDQIADALSRQIGHAVSLQGPIKLGFSQHGATFTIQNAAIGNPSWASRSVMAGIGSFDLGVELLPLLSKEFVVTRLELANADIQLETDANGHGNWDMAPAESPTTKTPDKSRPQPRNPVAIHINGIGIHDSRLAFRDREGKTSVFDVKQLTITQGSGAAFHFEGAYDNAPMTLDLATGIKDLLVPGGTWPFEADLTYSNYKLKAKGKASADKSQAEISSYEVTAGGSGLHGKLGIDWGAHPFLSGSLLGDRIDMADFRPAVPAQEGAGKGATQQQPSRRVKRLFSDTPLELGVLKSYNADLIVKIDEFVLPNGTLNHVAGRAELMNGILVVNPFKAQLGSGEIEAQLKLNADTAPSQIAMAIKAPEIKLEDTLRLLGAPDFLSGNAGVDVNLASTGDSPHALAGNSVGIINIVAGHGVVSSSAAGSIAAGLMALFAPGGSNNLNCLAARFIIRNGIGHDNGILVDTSSTTVAGNGGFDLGQEIIDMTLQAKTKQINVAALVPPLRVRGALTDPNFSIDPSETVQKVAGIFSGGSLDGNVPDIVTRPGQNACVYTLDHPSSGTTSTTAVPSNITGKLSSGLNAIKGFFGQ